MIPTKVFHSIACCVAITLSSCNPIEHKTTAAEKVSTSNEIKIDTVRCWVSKEPPYGWVGEGSSLFELSKCVKGYEIRVIKSGKIISSTFSDVTELNYWMDLVKYKVTEVYKAQ